VQYAHTFNRMFCNRYPHRRPLFLTARNEAGVSKLVRAHWIIPTTLLLTKPTTFILCIWRCSGKVQVL
jgi:hypothetical protein